MVNQGRRRHCTGGRTANQSPNDSTPPPIVMIAVGSSPIALIQAVPDSAMNSTKMHQPRSIRWPVFSRTGAAGGADAGCFV